MPSLFGMLLLAVMRMVSVLSICLANVPMNWRIASFSAPMLGCAARPLAQPTTRMLDHFPQRH
jgi:hypothetical protein